MQQKGRRGSAADGFDEFNEFIRDLNAEQNRRKFAGRNVVQTYLSMSLEAKNAINIKDTRSSYKG